MGWRKFLGIPFKHLGRDWDGLDCYGLLMLYAREVLGIELADWWYEEDWRKLGKNYLLENYEGVAYRIYEPERHDIVLLYTDIHIPIANHVGIIVEGDTFIQSVKCGVVQSNLKSPLVKAQTEGYYRLRR